MKLYTNLVPYEMSMCMPSLQDGVLKLAENSNLIEVGSIFKVVMVDQQFVYLKCKGQVSCVSGAILEMFFKESDYE